MSVDGAHLHLQRFPTIALPRLLHITYIVFRFKQVGWCFSTMTIAYFCSTKCESKIGICLVTVTCFSNPTSYSLGVSNVVQDRLTRIKHGMLYVKPKVQLSIAMIMIIHWNWDVIVWYRYLSRSHRRSQDLSTKTWYLRRFNWMPCKFSNRWIMYWQPIDLLDWPSNMEIGLCWYQNKNGPI